ncbi:NmrA family NAD(P)-binding protein [Cellulomonas carbonis]|uniref:NmrA family transcriptional regulator n=1 Tax=Cellulomonas carbonis T26 TaxID=947969 RepID=A0A0A0BQW0_9CELL|nr:NmrA family NAD(P)-binding protein [Cellulomonas carbonis]KGM10032.1 NmrA family transcriptional regulator [Cellulomonas carbonis T26]GGC17526.1 NmrA family transcriptional regulator [Cellulomonas carbonis]
MAAQVLVTGATGTVGSAVVAELERLGVPVRAAMRRPGPDSPEPSTTTSVRFDLADPTSWPDAFAGVDTMFLVRPPAVGDVRRGLLPAVAAARDHGVRHVVFLSLQGAERLRVVPHATVGEWLRSSGVTWTFVRASFFHQNLSTTHLADVRDRREIPVPAGDGRTAFVDAVDVGAVAARALADPAAHSNRAWTVTGPEALTYHEVAAVLSDELGTPVRYPRPGALRYAHHARRTLGLPWGMVAVTTAIYTTARLGLAAGLTDDVREVLGREPTDLRGFVRRERAVWQPADAGPAPAGRPDRRR